MNLQEQIRLILKEETHFKISSDELQLSESKIPIQVLRRHDLIDEMFKDMRIRYKRLFCKYRNPNILLGVLYERTLSDLYHAWFSETVSDDDWEVAAEYIEKYIIDKYEKETIDIWDKRCKSKTLKESKTSKEDYSDIETVINKIIPKSFSWFKKIEIDNISYSEFSNTLTIYGDLKVDEEWGAKQWRQYYDYKPFKPFPSNSGFRLGDIIGKLEIDDLNDQMEFIVSAVGNYSTIDTIRLGQLKLYFV
jgi:hypothetical protein